MLLPTSLRALLRQIWAYLAMHSTQFYISLRAPPVYSGSCSHVPDIIAFMDARCQCFLVPLPAWIRISHGYDGFVVGRAVHICLLLHLEAISCYFSALPSAKIALTAVKYNMRRRPMAAISSGTPGRRSGRLGTYPAGQAAFATINFLDVWESCNDHSNARTMT